MTEKEFKAFVEGDLASFMEKYKLSEIQVKDENGSKGKIKLTTSGMYVSDITTTNIL